MSAEAENKSPGRLSIVIPAYNEAENIAALSERLRSVMSGYDDWEALIVDDGSEDGTLSALEALSGEDERFKYLSFSRNFGHQSALKAGLDHATGDAIIMMDADLQHPPELIHDMVKKWREGFEVVYTVRDDRDISPFKRITADGFYRLLRALSNVDVDRGAADFRLIDRSVADVLREMDEANLFLRGLISWVGFRQRAIRYEPERRHAGTTKYSLRRMMLFALDGITSFSVRPLYLSVVLGLAVSALAFAYLAFAVVMALFTDRVVSGWASVISSVLLIGGLQLLMLGIIGEYLGKLFIQSKGRPLYIVRRKRL